MLMYLRRGARRKYVQHKRANTANSLDALAHRQILQLILNALRRLCLSLTKQLQIIVGHQATQIRLTILIRAVFLQFNL